MNEKTYFDTWKNPEATRVDRSESALRHLQKLQLPEQTEKQPVDILEIGSGIGGVTVALRELYPNSDILAVDRDERAGSVAQEMHIPFALIDLLNMDDLSAKNLLENKDFVVALRTSGEVVLKMLDVLTRNGFTGVFTFSLIEETDRSYFEKIDAFAKTHVDDFQFQMFFHRNFVTLENTRQFTERGYNVRFAKKEQRS